MSTKATLEQVREFIRHADAKELRLLADILNSRWKHLNAELSFDFSPGDKVWWIHGKRNPVRYHAEVISADGKWVYVNVLSLPSGRGGWNYKVAPTILKKVVEG